MALQVLASLPSVAIDENFYKPTTGETSNVTVDLTKPGTGDGHYHWAWNGTGNSGMSVLSKLLVGCRTRRDDLRNRIGRAA